MLGGCMRIQRCWHGEIRPLAWLGEFRPPKHLVFFCIGEYISLVLFYQFCQPPGVVHSFLRKKNVYVHIHKITRVVGLYTSLRFVEGVYKPQRACVGWASVTESCLGECMWIKCACLDEFPPGHSKMFERTLDIISLFIIVLAISNTINLFPIFVCCSLSVKTLGKWNYFTQTVQI